MPILDPVPGFNFTVLLFDVRESLLPRDVGEALGALGSLATGVGKSVLFGSFSKVSGLNAEVEVEEYHQGGDNARVLRFMKWGRFPNLVLERGVTPNTDLWDWGYQVLYGSKQPIRKNGLVLLDDRGGGVLGAADAEPTGLGLPVLDRTPVGLWFFRSGLPEKLTGPSLNATSNEIAIETLEIAHEGLLRVGPALIPGVGEVLAGVGL